MDDLVTHLKRLSGELGDNRRDNFRYDEPKRYAWQGKIKADPKAIANLASLPRPLKPPGKSLPKSAPEGT